MMETVQYQKQFQNGYIKIKVDGIWIFEHKFLIEDYLGRKLKEEERIHHINQIKSDNRLNNLVLFPTQKEHQKFHLKLKQFNYHTNPMYKRIKELKEDMRKERLNNMGGKNELTRIN